MRGAERVIEADEGCGFGHAITLHNGVTDAAEELHRRKCRAARDKRPEFPSEASVDAAESPRATKEFLPVGRFERTREPLFLLRRREVALDSRMKPVEHTRHGNQSGSALALDRANDLGRIRRRLKHNRRTEQRWNEQSHDLAEDVAERDERNEAQRMHPLFVTAIRIDTAFEWLEVGEEVSVGKDDASRFGRGAGG